MIGLLLLHYEIAGALVERLERLAAADANREILGGETAEMTLA